MAGLLIQFVKREREKESILIKHEGRTNEINIVPMTLVCHYIP